MQLNPQLPADTWFPNSIYVDLGTKLIPPHMLLKVCAQGANDEIDAVILGDPIPNRSLTSLPEHYSSTLMTLPVYCHSRAV